ncbi:MAG: hypothetical protein OXI01_15605 [Albidovulum sp.]|nr:hypothetical protein [Albidovulum sp.]
MSQRVSMNKSIALLGIGLILGGLTGFMLAAAYGITLDGHDHNHDLKTSMSDAGRMREQHQAREIAHDGQIVVLPEGPKAPKLEISVSADPASGWNLHIRTENFRFAPENASMAHVQGDGHAHVYVNGAKFARHYGAWLHISELPRGTNVIKVTLNANDHRQLRVGESWLKAEQVVEVK